MFLSAYGNTVMLEMQLCNEVGQCGVCDTKVKSVPTFGKGNAKIIKKDLNHVYIYDIQSKYVYMYQIIAYTLHEIDSHFMYIPR